MLVVWGKCTSDAPTPPPGYAKEGHIGWVGLGTILPPPISAIRAAMGIGAQPHPQKSIYSNEEGGPELKKLLHEKWPKSMFPLGEVISYRYKNWVQGGGSFCPRAPSNHLFNFSHHWTMPPYTQCESNTITVHTPPRPPGSCTTPFFCSVIVVLDILFSDASGLTLVFVASTFFLPNCI